MEKIIKNIALEILYFFLAAGLVASPALAQSSSKKPSDSNVKIVVEYKLVKDGLLNNDNLNVNINNNTITLTGYVPTIHARNEAVKDVRDAAGNYAVVNNIKIYEYQIPDSLVVKKVLSKIHNNAFYGVFDWVTASDTNGVLTLTGWVHYPWYKEWFQKDAENVVGVKKIVNNIKNTFGPGEIGYRAARLIYSDPMYQGMQYLSNPPVHIIVNNGSIILKGQVSSSGESGYIDYLVRFNTGAVRVNNDLAIRS